MFYSSTPFSIHHFEILIFANSVQSDIHRLQQQQQRHKNNKFNLFEGNFRTDGNVLFKYDDDDAFE